MTHPLAGKKQTPDHIAKGWLASIKSGPQNIRWRGGRTLRKDGYVLVYGGAPRVRLLEHRVVMETLLGRPLLRREVVHHIDGNPSNNAPENLQLFTSQAEHVQYEQAHNPRMTDPPHRSATLA